VKRNVASIRNHCFTSCWEINFNAKSCSRCSRD